LNEGGHSFARPAAADGELEAGGIKPCLPQIGTGWGLVAFLLAIRKGAMTIGASAASPKVQSRFHLVLVLRKYRR
jgi:hypothetical protein